MEQAHNAVLMLAAVIAVPVIIAAFFVARSIYRNTVGKKFRTTLREDYLNEAASFEKAGRFVSAANVYETKLNDYQMAASLYEKGGDFRKAASLYDLLGLALKAKEMYEKDGNLEDAAEISMREGEFEEAAKLYSKAGKKTDEALVMEQAGRILPAIRAYREAGDFRNAARLLEGEGMLKEAAEMFGLMLSGKAVDQSNMEDFYTFAFRLEKAGQTEKALETYRMIDKAAPLFRDVRERIIALSSSAEEEPPVDMEGKTSIRNFIRSGRLDPRHGFKLWFHMLKTLQNAKRNGLADGFICPENIIVDGSNNITFVRRTPSSAYAAPELSKGLAPDIRADIYSMGVVLYEMLTGSLEGLGSKRVIDIAHDVPYWLDEIVIRCIRKVREDRFQSIDEILTAVKELSKTKKAGE